MSAYPTPLAPPLPKDVKDYPAYLRAFEQYTLACTYFKRLGMSLSRRDGLSPVIAFHPDGRLECLPGDSDEGLPPLPRKERKWREPPSPRAPSGELPPLTIPPVTVRKDVDVSIPHRAVAPVPAEAVEAAVKQAAGALVGISDLLVSEAYNLDFDSDEEDELESGAPLPPKFWPKSQKITQAIDEFARNVVTRVPPVSVETEVVTTVTVEETVPVSIPPSRLETYRDAVLKSAPGPATPTPAKKAKAKGPSRPRVEVLAEEAKIAKLELAKARAVAAKAKVAPPPPPAKKLKPSQLRRILARAEKRVASSTAPQK